MRFEAELVSGQELLRTSLGHRSYLDTLSASQEEIEEINSCAVMSRPVAVTTNGRVLRCPLCRQLTRSDAVTFVRVNPVANDDAIPEIEVRGTP